MLKSIEESLMSTSSSSILFLILSFNCQLLGNQIDYQAKIAETEKTWRKERKGIKKNSMRLKSFVKNSKSCGRICNISKLIKYNLIPMSGFSKKDGLFLIFSPTHYTTTLVAGNYELRSGIYPSKSYYRILSRKAFRAGWFFHFPNVEAKLIKQAQNYIRDMQGHKAATCLHGAAEALSRGAGVKPPTYNLTKASKFMKKALDNGFVDHEGNKVESQLYIVNKMDIEEVYKALDAKRSSHKLIGGPLVGVAKIAFKLYWPSSKSLKTQYFQDWKFPRRRF